MSRRGGIYRGADKSLARPGRKQATATEDFDFHISYLVWPRRDADPSPPTSAEVKNRVELYLYSP